MFRMTNLNETLDQLQDIVRLTPQIVGRFYGDGNRLGQRPANTPKPAYYQPERWIGSATEAANPPGIPSGGLSTCPDLGGALLRNVVADAEVGPRLLGENRFTAHGGTFRVLIKLLDAVCPIPFHVHANDAFVQSHRDVYPNESFGKAEAYHFLSAPKGDCAYTHVGVYDGVTAKDVIASMRRSTDHVLELSPGALQNFGEGWFVEGGMLHRPGTALTLEIQQPSDVYTMFQTDFGGEPMPQEVLHPGFDTIEAAAEAVINWERNLRPNLVEELRLRPTATGAHGCEWIFPPTATDHFSGQRITVDASLTFKADDPFVLYVWRGRGTMDGKAIDGGGGPAGAADEFFVGVNAAKRGLALVNVGDEPLVAFALFAAKV